MPPGTHPGSVDDHSPPRLGPALCLCRDWLWTMNDGVVVNSLGSVENDRSGLHMQPTSARCARKPPDIHRPKQVSSFPAIFHPSRVMSPLVCRGGPASSAPASLDPGQAVPGPCTDPSLCPTMSEHPSTSDLLSECNSGELPVAAHTLDRSAEPPLHPSTERPERLPRARKVGGPADNPARTDTDYERSCEPVLEYRFPVSGLRHMTRAALRALHCDSCNGQGHESRDCPVRARDPCIFCGSTYRAPARMH